MSTNSTNFLPVLQKYTNVTIDGIQLGKAIEFKVLEKM